MTDLEDRIRSSLHAAAEHLPDSSASQVQALDLALARKPQRRGPLAALAAFVAVLVVLGGTILLWGGLADDTPVVVGQPETVTIDQLDAAVRPAVNALADAPGLVATQEAFFDGQLGESVWVDYRSNGDFISVLAADLAAVGKGRIGKSAVAYVDGTFYLASISADGIDVPWHQLEEEPALPEPPIPLGVLLPEGLYPSNTEEPGAVQVEATRQNMSDGGTRWTLTQLLSDGTFTQHWGIHPDGHLRTYSVETDQLGDPSLFPSGLPSGRIDFTPLVRPDPIAPPEVGTTLNPTEYDIPEDLALLP